MIVSSSHNLQCHGNEIRCLDCAGVVVRASPDVRNWLKSKCLVCPFNDQDSLVPIPPWHVVQVKGSIVHFSHSLFSLRGIFVCEFCGGFGAQRFNKLARECEKRLSTAGQRALDKMRAGELPVPIMTWPRAPNLNVWQPPSIQHVQSSATQTLSHFDDPFHEVPDEE